MNAPCPPSALVGCDNFIYIYMMQSLLLCNSVSPMDEEVLEGGSGPNKEMSR